MIKSFRIRNLATIEDIELSLQEGFSILTGETGAGKSIIIDGIRLVLGEKGSAEIIRTGEEETVVEAVFHVPSPVPSLEPFVSAGEQHLYVQRKIPKTGTGKSYVNGTLVPAKKLHAFRDDLVDIYGQNDHVFLRRVEYQLDYLDAYADALPLRRELSETAQELRKECRERSRLEAREKEREKRLDFLRFQAREIEKADLRPGEEEEILQERHILKNAEKVRRLLDEALDLSYAGERPVSSLLSRLEQVVRELAGFESTFRETEASIGQFRITINDLAESLMRLQDKQAVSPGRLEKLEERLSLIENLKRKYGDSVEEILVYREKAEAEIRELEAGHEKLAELEREIERAFSRYTALALRLSEKRKRAARVLEREVEKAIRNLGMKRARFKISVASALPDRENMDRVRDAGSEEVEFLISPNPGEELRPLRRIASGGELSRIMLALKSVGKEAQSMKTLIFDEIDSGIGGKTAEYVARKLRELSRRHQVICITHLPQIASFAAHHFRIEKQVEKNRTFTRVAALDFEERVKEIARLLAGSRITATSLRNAREMLLFNLGQDSPDGERKTPGSPSPGSKGNPS